MDILKKVVDWFDNNTGLVKVVLIGLGMFAIAYIIGTLSVYAVTPKVDYQAREQSRAETFTKAVSGAATTYCEDRILDKRKKVDAYVELGDIDAIAKENKEINLLQEDCINQALLVFQKTE